MFKGREGMTRKDSNIECSRQMGLIRKVAKHLHLTYRMVNVYLKESCSGPLFGEEEDYTNSSKSWVSWYLVSWTNNGWRGSGI